MRSRFIDWRMSFSKNRFPLFRDMRWLVFFITILSLRFTCYATVSGDYKAELVSDQHTVRSELAPEFITVNYLNAIVEET